MALEIMGGNPETIDVQHEISQVPFRSA